MKIRSDVLLATALVATSLNGAAATAKGPYSRTIHAATSSTDKAPNADPLMSVAWAEMAASNSHDPAGFMQAFTKDAVILADAPPYSYRDEAGLTDFFKHSLLGSRVQYSIKPGAPQTEDCVGDHAYLEMVVNIRATDDKGDSFNDPIHWISVLVRQNGVWKIAGLTLTTIGG